MGAGASVDEAAEKALAQDLASPELKPALRQFIKMRKMGVPAQACLNQIRLRPDIVADDACLQALQTCVDEVTLLNEAKGEPELGTLLQAFGRRGAAPVALHGMADAKSDRFALYGFDDPDAFYAFEDAVGQMIEAHRTPDDIRAWAQARGNLAPTALGFLEGKLAVLGKYEVLERSLEARMRPAAAAGADDPRGVPAESK
mmetsp:Transcript_21782/g.49266  ORF Transcript_21782/g.49266 Transcript_21782/m.49266 type:complete len:201 (+) Transcript_21782:69-671(+)